MAPRLPDEPAMADYDYRLLLVICSGFFSGAQSQSTRSHGPLAASGRNGGGGEESGVGG